MAAPAVPSIGRRVEGERPAHRKGYLHGPGMAVFNPIVDCEVARVRAQADALEQRQRGQTLAGGQPGLTLHCQVPSPAEVVEQRSKRAVGRIAQFAHLARREFAEATG
jgi:hypothetical protein